jgi:hypothetical protein
MSKFQSTYSSDGTVTVRSQTAYPGVLDEFKNRMDKTNHLEMRNNKETEKAFLKIFNGQGVHEYFIVPKLNN